MALFKFIETTSAKITDSSIPVVQGQFIVTRDGKSYYDAGTSGGSATRVELTPDISAQLENYLLKTFTTNVVKNASFATTLEENGLYEFKVDNINPANNGETTTTYIIKSDGSLEASYDDAQKTLTLNVKVDGTISDSGVLPVTGAAVKTYVDDAITTAVANGAPNYTMVTKSGAQTDSQALATISSPKKGDIAAVRGLITGDKYAYTGYVYNGTNWGAMDGNYDAENVYFGKDLTITAPIGVQTPDASGSKTLDTTGLNVKQVFDLIMAKEANPSVTQPSVSVSLSGGGAKEIGTTVTPNWTANLNGGSYQFGPATGITNETATWAITDNLEEPNSAATRTGSFDPVTLAAGQTYTLTATATYADGAMPVTNLGNNYAAGQIKAGSKSASASFTTYRMGFFYGTVTSALGSASEATSAMIRGLTKSNKAYTAGNVNYTVKPGAASIILACPATNTGVTKVLNTTVNADMTTAFGAPATIKVAGADGNPESDYAADYKVWVYTPAEAYASDAALTITLG